MSHQIIIDLSDAQWHAINTIDPTPGTYVTNYVLERINAIFASVYEEQVAVLLNDPDIETMPANRDAVVLNAELPEWLPVEES